MTGGAAEPLIRPRLLLTGDAAARPDGLERALTRAGFQIGEVPPGPHDPPPDALLTTLDSAEPDRLGRLLADASVEPPRIIVFAAEDRDAPGAALALGAADALAAPIHLPDLCARIAARVRDRQAPVRTPYETRVRDSLRDLVEEARTLLLPDEVALALIRRLGRALELAHCSYVQVGPGDDQGRVIADFDADRAEHGRLDLARHPEIAEAIRSRRTLAMPDTRTQGVGAGPTIVLPVVLHDVVTGVLLMRGRPAAPSLGGAQLGLASDLAEAAARALDGGRAASGRPTRRLTPLPLDRRLDEELERARRYSLGFSLVLLDADAPSEADADAESLIRRRQETGARLRRELRLPDFVSNYGEGEYALVLPETGADGARRSVLRLRERLIGGSAGIVAYPHPAVTVPDDLFALVEAALHRGRAQSGERIGVAD
ncbi:MAG TPA: GAF domain-containing protein [Gemmatimonadales bacterium]|nr:GAF domain-containing protein [Gemmatimonadales bacterium]